MSSLDKRVEQMYLELYAQVRNRPARQPKTSAIINTNTSPADDQIERYEFHLNQAYKSAPCRGCKTLVESAIVGVRIFKLMDEYNLKREDITEEKSSIATRAALEVMSERCGGEDDTVNDALGAAKAALDHLSSKGKVVFFKEIQKIYRTGEHWEVEIDSTKFTGTIEISSEGKAKILE